MSCENCLNRGDFLAKPAFAAATVRLARRFRTYRPGDPNAPTTPGVAITLASFPALATTYDPVTGTVAVA
ncbi:MAG: hypothetical protein ABI442_04165 [Gemmatimonadaceae bacterium]